MKSKIYSLTFVFVLFVFACGSNSGFDPYSPIFTDPLKKITETEGHNFTEQLLEDANSYEPLIQTSGTQVHMGYWSGPGNHGSLVRLLDAINAYTSGEGEPINKAIWDEGAQTSLQYPSYVTMNEEHWYERSNAVDDVVTIYGEEYTDPFPVTFAQADQIWGQYSERYADMATAIHDTTGKVVNAWCFVIGAKSNRIFYTYELPELRTLEKAGDVVVYFAKTQDADWQNPDDWTEGTANAPEPIVSNITTIDDIEHLNREQIESN